MYKPTPHFTAFGILAAIVLGALFLTGCDPAKAQVTSDVITWTAPTQRVDGSALAPSEILQYQILSARVCTGTFTLLQTVGPSPLSFTRANRQPGRECYKLRTVDTAGVVSPDSAIVFTEKCPLGQRVNAAGDCVVVAAPREPSNVGVT